MITGFALGYLVFDTLDLPSATDKHTKITAGVLLAIYYIGGLALFYTVIDTDSV